MIASLWAAMEHPIVATVVAAFVLGMGAWAGRGIRRALHNVSALGTWVVPHFQPQPDEHGIPRDDHTLPARFDQLRQDLTTHMDDEIVLRHSDLKRMDDWEKKLDDVLERITAGNPEVRQP